MIRLYVGNLSVQISQDDLTNLFSKRGEIISVSLVCDKHNQSLGYGFVEMEDREDAQKAIESLDGLEYKGRHIRVKEAAKDVIPKLKEPRRSK